MSTPAAKVISRVGFPALLMLFLYMLQAPNLTSDYAVISQAIIPCNSSAFSNNLFIEIDGAIGAYLPEGWVIF